MVSGSPLSPGPSPARGEGSGAVLEAAPLPCGRGVGERDSALAIRLLQATSARTTIAIGQLLA